MNKKLLFMLFALFPLLAIHAFEASQFQQTTGKEIIQLQNDTIKGKHHNHIFIGNSQDGYHVTVGSWNPDNSAKHTLTGIIRDARAAGLIESNDIISLSKEIALFNMISDPNKIEPGQIIFLKPQEIPENETASIPESVITEVPVKEKEVLTIEKPVSEPVTEVVHKEEQEKLVAEDDKTEETPEISIETMVQELTEPKQDLQIGNITGRVVETTTQRGLPSILVSVNEQQVLTDANGVFSLLNTTPGKTQITFTAAGFETKTMEIVVGFETNLGVIELDPITFTDPEDIPEINLEMFDMDDDARAQNISGLLHSAGDIFTSFASFSFGQAWFRMRGYDNELTPTYIGNSLISDAETGRTMWAIWGGLNDATRNSTFVNGLGVAPNSFGGIGGISNIITRPSQQRVQTKFTYSASNRSYTHRMMFIHSTGMMANDWAVTVSGSRRWGQSGYIEGTFYDAWAYYLGLEHRINNKHSFELTTFAAPVRRGMQGGSVREIYNLLGTNHYSPNWGYQNGEVRNSRVRTMNQPVLILNHYWRYNNNTDITTTASYMFGKTGTTAMNWYNASDPRPDYYRYLPSWFEDPEISALVRDNWLNDPSVSQVNWNSLYQANYLANLEGKQSRYIIEDRRNDMNNLNLSTFVNHRMNENIAINSGIELSNFTVNYFKTIDDLLGGTYWVDIDQFAERDFPDEEIRQNDLDNPNRVVREGDVFGYNYDLKQQSGKLWISGDFSYRKVDFFMAAQLSSTTFWREGFMRNGRHPENSLGESAKHNFMDYGIKGGATYKISGRHFLDANVAYLTQAPYMRNSFVSPRTRNDVSPGLQSEKIFSTDLNFHVRAPMVKFRASLYHTEFRDQNQILTFYHDDFRTLVNHIMYGINTTHQGLELGGEVHMIYDVWLQGALNLGNYRYINRPEATIAFDNASRPDTTTLTYLKNFFITGTPQTAGAIGLKWVGPRYLFVNLSLNYFDDIWLSFNPERRTQQAIANIGPGDPQIADITHQEMLSGGYTMDASIGKSFRIKRKYFLQINLMANNLLNNKNISSGGYEQLRFDFENKDVDKFPPRYFYMMGTNYFLNLALRF
jgi:hypothetical protein